MSEWYVAIDGEQLGPVDEDKMREMITEHPDALLWREGLENWETAETAFQDNSELTSLLVTEADFATPVSTDVSDLKPKTAIKSKILKKEIDQNSKKYDHSAWLEPSGSDGDGKDEPEIQSDIVDYEVVGHDSQYVIVELDPGEAVIAQPGTMMFKSGHIDMNAIMGDGENQNKEVLGRLFKAGRRIFSGENLFMSIFTNNGYQKEQIAFAGPAPGHILPFDLRKLGGEIICQKQSYLCAAKGVEIDIYFKKNILTGIFGGEGFIMQRLSGDGLAFLHAGGAVKEIDLDEGETLHVDTGSLVAIQPCVQFDVQTVGSLKTMVTGGEGMFFARVTGPGKVWIQSMPISRLAQQMLEVGAGSR